MREGTAHHPPKAWTPQELALAPILGVTLLCPEKESWTPTGSSWFVFLVETPLVQHKDHMGFHLGVSEIPPAQDLPLVSAVRDAPPLPSSSGPRPAPYSETSVHHTALPLVRAGKTLRPSAPAQLPERRGRVGTRTCEGPTQPRSSYDSTRRHRARLHKPHSPQGITSSPGSGSGEKPGRGRCASSD